MLSPCDRMNKSAFSFALLLSVLPLAADPAATPFNGKDLTGWEAKKKDSGASKWTVGEPAMPAANPAVLEAKPGGAALINAVAGHGQGFDLYSKDKWGDVTLEIEVMVPKGSNSGIYLMGEYEVQVFDSYGKKDIGGGDMGAIYGAQPPKENASREPGQWQQYRIVFQAPRFDADGKKTDNAKFLRVELNGKLLHENVVMNGPTPGGVTGKEAPTGPIMFQGDHGAVAYRNLKITPAAPAGK